MTQLLIRALSEQMATATPSSSAVSFSNGAASSVAAGGGPATTQAAGSAPAAAVAGNSDLPDPSTSIADSMEAVARQIESYLRSIGRMLEFRVDEDSGRTVITVRDSRTGETVRQIPGDEALRLARALGTQPNALLDILV